MFSDVGLEAIIFIGFVYVLFSIPYIVLSLLIVFVIKKIIERIYKRRMYVGQLLMLTILVMVVLNFLRNFVFSR